MSLTVPYMKDEKLACHNTTFQSLHVLLYAFAVCTVHILPKEYRNVQSMRCVHLKVVGNEKEGGSGMCQTVPICLRPRRLMFFSLSILLSSLILRISVSVPVKQNEQAMSTELAKRCHKIYVFFPPLYGALPIDAPSHSAFLGKARRAVKKPAKY